MFCFVWVGRYFGDYQVNQEEKEACQVCKTPIPKKNIHEYTLDDSTVRVCWDCAGRIRSGRGRDLPVSEQVSERSTQT